MAYQNTNTNMALRDLRSMLAEMPEQRSMRDYRSVLGRGEELKAMMGAKEHEMRLPALQLQQAQAQTELDQMNAPFRIQNLAQAVDEPNGDYAPQVAAGGGGPNGPAGFGGYGTVKKANAGPYDVKIFPDQAAMLVQDQKYGPPALKQFEDNVRQMGYQIAPDGSFLKKDGTPLSYREAAPVHREWMRTLFLNTDMEKHRDNQVAWLESKGNLTPQETAGLQKLKALTPLQLAEMRLEKLQQIQLEDPMWGRPEGQLLQPMIEQASARVQELKGKDALKSERDWKEKVMREEYRLKGGLVDKQIKAASEKKDSRGSFQKDVEFFSQATGIPVKDAAEMFRNDKTMAERLRAASAEIEAFTNSMAGMKMDEQQMRDLIDQTYAKYQILGPDQQPQVPENDPLGIR